MSVLLLFLFHLLTFASIYRCFASNDCTFASFFLCFFFFFSVKRYCCRMCVIEYLTLTHFVNLVYTQNTTFSWNFCHFSLYPVQTHISKATNQWLAFQLIWWWFLWKWRDKKQTKNRTTKWFRSAWALHSRSPIIIIILYYHC